MVASEYNFAGGQTDYYECCGCYVKAENHRYNPTIKPVMKVLTLNRQTVGVVTSPWGTVWVGGSSRDMVKRVLSEHYRLRSSLVPKSVTR